MCDLNVINGLVQDTDDSYVARLAMLSGVAVYRDILPGYRIRLPTGKELEVKVRACGQSGNRGMCAKREGADFVDMTGGCTQRWGLRTYNWKSCICCAQFVVVTC